MKIDIAGGRVYPNLTTFEKEQLLHFFHYNLTMEQRIQLMRTLPQAYNHLVEAQCAKVVYVDGEKPV